MKIELEFENQNEFNIFMAGLNNALVAYYDIVSSIILGCEIPRKWIPLENKEGEKKVKQRYDILSKYYNQLTEIEKNGKIL